MVIFEEYQTVPVIALSDMDPYMQLHPKHQHFPIPGEAFAFFRLDLSHALIKNPAETYFVQATEDALIEEGIIPGDVLVVDRSMEAKHGSMVVAFLEGEFVLRKLLIRPHGLSLLKAHPEKELVDIEPEMAFGIWGVIRDYLQVRFEV
ncbi:MAG: hypothetical protein MK226_23760 [Saprospiraceae bacterium]|nr:hypothetical protein [Saprospiraceae bacterium]